MNPESDLSNPTRHTDLCNQLALAEGAYMDAGDHDRASVMYHARHRILAMGSELRSLRSTLVAIGEGRACGYGGPIDA